MRDYCLSQLQTKFERFLGSGKSLVTEDALFSSASMKTLSAQVSALLAEVGLRESLEV